MKPNPAEFTKSILTMVPRVMPHKNETSEQEKSRVGGDLVKKCQACSGDQFIKLYSVEDTNQFVEGKWSIEQCRNCKLGRLTPFPSPNEVSSFYTDVFYDVSGKRFRPFVEHLRLFFAGLRGRTLNKICAQKGRILDFGSGAGNFSKAMEKQGWQVTNLDPYSSSSENSKLAETVNGRIIFQSANNTFDVVTLWYVIEHLWDPSSAIAEFNKVLKPNGILVLSQQDFSSVQANLFKASWLFLDPPRHLFQFSQQNLELIAKRHGFETIKVTHSSLEMGPFTILQSMLNILLGNYNFLFRFLKSKKLKSPTSKISAFRNSVSTLISIILLPVLGTFAFLAYVILVSFGSGDIFTLYLRKVDDAHCGR